MSEDKAQLFLLGVSHRETPLAVRETFAVSEEGAERLYERLAGDEAVRECVILNTCNRVEIYGVAQAASLRARVSEHVCASQDFETSLFAEHSHWLAGMDVVHHLFKVVCGLDSQMVGETEILGQVKQAYAAAGEHEAPGPVLNRLFQKSFQTAKWIRTHTAIGQGQVSIGNVAADLAMRIVGDLDDCRILALGTGEVGEQTVTALKNRGKPSITVSGRTLGRARMLASRFDGVAVDFEHFSSIVHYFDVVVCATSARGVVLRHEAVKSAIKRRPELPLFIIDQAVPRDVEATVGDLANVYLYNLDDLSSIANRNLKTRKAELRKCSRLVGEKAGYLWEHLRSHLTGSREQARDRARHQG